MSEHTSVETTPTRYGKDRPKARNPLKVQDLTFRDGHQSLFATRGRTEDMIPIAEMMDEVGFWAVETWGGATFDTMHRFLNEDPWERLRRLKRYMKKTPFSMLLRGQNLVGYRNYADDLAIAFVGRAAANGVDIFRVFDALNDFRNLETVVKAIKEAGKHFQGCICYSLTEPRMGGEVYTLEYYEHRAKELESMGADSICIKDMAGLIAPYDAYALVTALKKAVGPPIHLHSHYTSGMASMSHLKAIEAGADIVDTCMAPYALRTSHPAVEPLVMTLLGTNRDTGFDIQLLARIDEILETQIMPKYRHLLDDTKVSTIDINVLLHQTPGGMLSNLVNQLREMNALDKLDRVMSELPRVRKDLGQVPLVTPTSQIVGIQTVNNVLFDTGDSRYTMITDQVKDLCYGLYGKTVAPIDPEVRRKALHGYPRGEEPITARPADVLDPELDKARQEAEGLARDLDDVLVYALYNVTGRRFLKWKYGLEEPPAQVRPLTLEAVRAEEDRIKKARAGLLVEKTDKKDAPRIGGAMRKFHVLVDDEWFDVSVADEAATAVSAVAQPSPAPPQAPPAEPRTPTVAAPPAEAVVPATPVGIPVTAPMPGMVVRLVKNVGDPVEKGEPVVILEAMKMQNAIPAPAGGTVTEVRCKVGDSVARGAVLCVIR